MSKRIIFIFLLTLSCGSGTFENDPETWQKVFGEEIPSEIEVLNSRFWKSAHWTYEFELFTKIKSDKKFIQDYFIDHYKLKNNEVYSTLFLEDIPNWFIKNNNSKEFEVWQGGPNSITLYLHKYEDIVYIHILQI